MGDGLARLVVVVVLIAWVATTVVMPILVRGYSPPPEISTVMGAIAGAAGAASFAKRTRSRRRQQEIQKSLPKPPEEDE